jgi:hypothetical protein
VRQPCNFNKLCRFFVPGASPEPSHHFWGCDAHKRHSKSQLNYSILPPDLYHFLQVTYFTCKPGEKNKAL